MLAENYFKNLYLLFFKGMLSGRISSVQVVTAQLKNCFTVHHKNTSSIERHW